MRSTNISAKRNYRTCLGLRVHVAVLMIQEGVLHCSYTSSFLGNISIENGFWGSRFPKLTFQMLCTCGIEYNSWLSLLVLLGCVWRRKMQYACNTYSTINSTYRLSILNVVKMLVKERTLYSQSSPPWLLPDARLRSDDRKKVECFWKTWAIWTDNSLECVVRKHP